MIVFDTATLDDPESIFEFNLEQDATAALDHIETIRSAVLIPDER